MARFLVDETGGCEAVTANHRPGQRRDTVINHTSSAISDTLHHSVVVVEPSRLIRDVIRAACRQRGFDVAAAQDVAGALAQIAQHKPTFVLTAAELPGLGGPSLIAALKASCQHRAIPVALLTSNLAGAQGLPHPHADTVIAKDTHLTGNVLAFLDAFSHNGDEHGPDRHGPPLHGRILLAEDATVIHKLISRFLHVAGAEVTVVEDGAAALCAGTDTTLDLILMDVEMPKMGGLAVTARLRECGVRIPIVALTAHPVAELRAAAAAAGLTDVLPKPIDRHTLIRRCAALLPAPPPAPVS